MTAGGSWIKLYRSTARHPLWLAEPFTIGQAWVDLLMSANYQESTAIRGPSVLKIGRGQVLTSVARLGTRWRRDKKTVRRWLRVYERDGMLARAVGHGADGGYTLLTLLNYEEFQSRHEGNRDDGRVDGLDDGRVDGRDFQGDDGRDDGRDPSKKYEEGSKEAIEEREERERARARAESLSSNGSTGPREVRL
jgi:hypothetical protein